MEFGFYTGTTEAGTIIQTGDFLIVNLKISSTSLSVVILGNQ